jgi:hypothetical protein
MTPQQALQLYLSRARPDGSVSTVSLDVAQVIVTPQFGGLLVRLSRDLHRKGRWTGSLLLRSAEVPDGSRQLVVWTSVQGFRSTEAAAEWAAEAVRGLGRDFAAVLPPLTP